MWYDTEGHNLYSSPNYCRMVNPSNTKTDQSMICKQIIYVLLHTTAPFQGRKKKNYTSDGKKYKHTFLNTWNSRNWT